MKKHRLFLLRMLIDCRSGIAFLEFAIVLPVLLLFLFGTVELSRYALINQKLDKVVNSMGDFATQGSSLSNANLDGFARAVPQIMRPFTFPGDTIIFSSVTVQSFPTAQCPTINVSCLAWQRRVRGNKVSAIGSHPGDEVTLPGGYNVPKGRDVIVAELFYEYSPLMPEVIHFIPAFASHTIYKIAVYKPRHGALTVPPG